MKKSTLLLALAGAFLLCFYDDDQQPKNSGFDFHTYWSHYNNAQYAMEVKKDYAAALLEFQWLEKNGTRSLPQCYDFVEESICYIKTGDTLAAIECLRKAVRSGALHLLETEWARREIGEGPFAIIADEMDTLRNEFYRRNIDLIPSFIAEHERFTLDQYLRSETVTNLISNHELDSLLYITDSINITGLMRDIRNGKARAASSLTYHLYDNNANYAPFFDSCMRAEMFRGECSPAMYAGWYDRQLAYVNHEPQRYGAFTIYRMTDPYKPNLLMGIENIDSVDIYRKEIGLPPLWQECERINLEIPEGYKRQ